MLLWNSLSVAFQSFSELSKYKIPEEPVSFLDSNFILSYFVISIKSYNICFCNFRFLEFFKNFYQSLSNGTLEQIIYLYSPKKNKKLNDLCNGLSAAFKSHRPTRDDNWRITWTNLMENRKLFCFIWETNSQWPSRKWMWILPRKMVLVSWWRHKAHSNVSKRVVLLVLSFIVCFQWNFIC